MMLFSSFFLPSFGFFVLYCCRLTAAATLAVSPVKPRAYDWLECSGPLPPQIQYPFATVMTMCARRWNVPYNMGCECRGSNLVCGASHRERIRELIFWCFFNCNCGENTIQESHQFTMDLDQVDMRKFDVHGKEVVDSPQPHSGNNPTGDSHTCSGTCTSVNHGCKSASPRDCGCFAPPVGLFYWHLGDCGTRLPFKAKRDLAQQRRDYYLNATARYASSNDATATPPHPPGLHAQQLASGLLPSPCNASYVSFACADSTDGIVHEPPQNWLGALLPENAKELPPVPEEFLRIHHGKEGKMHVLRPAVD